MGWPSRYDGAVGVLRATPSGTARLLLCKVGDGPVSGVQVIEQAVENDGAPTIDDRSRQDRLSGRRFAKGRSVAWRRPESLVSSAIGASCSRRSGARQSGYSASVGVRAFARCHDHRQRTAKTLCSRHLLPSIGRQPFRSWKLRAKFVRRNKLLVVGDSLTVEQRTLTPLVEVRILVPQPN